MTEKDPKKARKWYQKKRYLIPLGILGLIALSGGGNSAPQVKPQASIVAPLQQEYKPVSDSVKAIPVQQNTNNLSNDNYYTNVNGNTVHSPAYTNDSSIPQGASAQCGDGTYSFSQNRRGTCSHHGGVSEWL